jgi:Ion channel
VSLRPLKIADRDAANKYGVVVLLLCLVYIATVSVNGTTALSLVMLLQLVTLWLTFSASESPKARRVAGLACLVVATLDIAGIVFGRAFDFEVSNLRILAVVSAVLYLITPYVILRHLIKRPVVDGRTILGAVAIYLMLGMMFAFSYRAISLYQTTPAFFGDAGMGTNADFLFFSFITLTTTGYGDLVPAANPGQSIAVLEAIVGQLFLVTALAKIVNAWRMPGLGDSSDDSASS